LHQALSQTLGMTSMGMPGGLTPVNVSQLNTNANLKDSLDFGAQSIIAQGIQAGQLNANSVFTVFQVYNIYQQVVAGINYVFNVLLSDGQGTTIQANYTIWDQLNGTKNLTNSTYAVIYTNVPGGYTPCAQSEIANSTRLHDGLIFGINAITQQAIGEGQLSSNSVLNVSDIYNVYKKIVAGISYQYDVLLSNGYGQEVSATFTVWCQLNGSMTLTNSTFQVVNTTTPGGFSQISSSELDTNPIIMDCLDFGVKAVVAKAVSNGKLSSNSVFSVAEVYSIYEKVVAGIDYQFDILLSDGNGQQVSTTFTVWRQPDGTLTLTSSDYQLLANDGGSSDVVITTSAKFSLKTSLSCAFLTLFGLTFIL